MKLVFTRRSSIVVVRRASAPPRVRPSLPHLESWVCRSALPPLFRIAESARLSASTHKPSSHSLIFLPWPPQHPCLGDAVPHAPPPRSRLCAAPSASLRVAPSASAPLPPPPLWPPPRSGATSAASSVGEGRAGLLPLRSASLHRGREHGRCPWKLRPGGRQRRRGSVTTAARCRTPSATPPSGYGKGLGQAVPGETPAGSSAFQVEGAAAEDGRAPSIWDTFTHEGYSYDGATADVSADQYHHYKEDVKLMHAMGLDAYRFSIAWPRLILDGRGEINPKGLEYYNNLIDELILTVLQDEYGGLLSPRFIEDYTAFAEVYFEHFGDRVKHWVTLNEPNIEPIGSYDNDSQPPRRCSYPFGKNCTGGDSSTEPYIAAHHLLLAHASAVSLYKNKYQSIQGGQIGITLLGWWHEPTTNTAKDAAAASRMNDFHIGWFMHPLVYGEYPPVMRSRVGDRLPRLSAEAVARASGSFDFVGFNHYRIL